MSRFIGKKEDLKDKKSESSNGRIRYFCPYCDSIHGKSQDREGCLLWNEHTLSGWCFRCETIVTHDGLKDANYVMKKLKGTSSFEAEQKASNDKVFAGWLLSYRESMEAYIYLTQERLILPQVLDRFDVLCCEDPFNAIAIPNKNLGNGYTDYLYVRGYDNTGIKHNFVKDITKKACWLDKIESNNIVLCEGFFDGLAIYQHLMLNDIKADPVPISGKSITQYQAISLKRKLSSINNPEITICMDGGFFEDTLKIAKTVYNYCFNAKVSVMTLPYNKDPNEVDKDTFLRYYAKRMEFEPSKVKYIRNKVYKNNVIN